MKEVVASGRTVEDAKSEAFRELGVESEEDVEIEIIDEGSKGVFGWGTKFARVKVKLLNEPEEKEEKKKPEKKVEKEPEKKVEKPRKKEEKKPVKEEKPIKEEEPEDSKASSMMSLEPTPRPEDISEPIRVKSEIPPITVGERPLPRSDDYKSRKTERPRRPERKPEREYRKKEKEPEKPAEEEPVEEEPVELLKEEESGPYNPRDIIHKIMDHMGTEGEIKLMKSGGEPVYSIEGKNLGILIGKHGQTLEAIQFIVNLIRMRKNDTRNKVTVDVEGYRARREKSLRDLARRLADKAKREKRNVVLEPMLPSERRIIHLTLQNNAHVYTYSKGEEPMRRVVISPKKKRDRKDRR